MEKSKEKIKLIKESKNVLKRRELEQTQELLVGLTNELFNKIEKMEKKETSENKEFDTGKETSESDEINTPKEKSKIEFSDLSWYRNKLDSTQKK